MKDPGVVDQGVHAPEPVDRHVHDPLRGRGLRNVASYRDEVGCLGCLDRARRADYRVAGAAEASTSPAPPHVASGHLTLSRRERHDGKPRAGPGSVSIRVGRGRRLGSPLGAEIDEQQLQVYPPGAIVVLPGGTPHFHWAKSGTYVTQVTAIGPLGLDYIDPADDPRNG